MKKNKVFAAAALVALSAVALPALADGFSIQAGSYEQRRRLALNYETAPLWQTSLGSTRLELVGEAGVAYWRTSEKPVRGFETRMWQVSAAPLLRWWPVDWLYLEGGIGIAGVSETKFQDKNLATHFQFVDHLGIGVRVGRSSKLGVRMTHISNAGLKDPNQGLNSVQLNFSTAF